MKIVEMYDDEAIENVAASLKYHNDELILIGYNLRKMEKGVANIHGGTIPTPTNLKEEKRFNVGVDLCGYAPVAYDNIMKIISKAK